MPGFTADDLSQHVASLRALARDLLADAHLAEDAVQQACVAALARPPAATAGLGAWLRAAVRSCALDLWRSESRRRARELAVARPLAHEGCDAAEQLELHEDIAAAVRSLDEPYRTAVWLRYYEHRTPREIALQLGAPVKTVKTRLSRALEMLRQKLDARHGDRSAWVVAIAREARRAATVAAAATTGVLMKSQFAVVAAAAMLLVAAGAWWSLSMPSPSRGTGAPLPPPAVDTAATPPERSAPESAIAREAAAPTATSPYGALRAHVRWHDGSPAADVAITVVAEGEPQVDRNELRIVSDGAGLAEATRVRAGRVQLHSDRGGNAATDVEGGRTRDVEFTLPRGVDVAGTVLDERRRPVRAAEVVLVSPRGGWLGGRTLATSDGAGAFTLRSVDARWSVGVRARGFAPSPLVDLEDVAAPANGQPARIELVLSAPGATVVGKVVDDGGAAIAGATVVLGRGPFAHYDLGRAREFWSPHVVTTEANGTFRCDGVQPGEQPLAARADGCGRAANSVMCVAGETASVTLVLPRGGIVRGTVRDEAGQAVEGAIVTTVDTDVDENLDSALGDRPEVKRSRARSGPDGTYELRGVPAGDAQLLATKQLGSDRFRFEGLCQTTLPVVPGTELTWDPVLRAGKTIRVRIVDAEGKPAHYGSGVYAMAEQPAGLLTSLTTFPERDPLGLCVFSPCAEVPYTITANVDVGGTRSWVYVAGVIPGGADAVLRLPPKPTAQAPGSIRVRIDDAGQRFDGGKPSVSLCTSVMRQSFAVRDGLYSVEDVEPGRYFLWVRHHNDEPVLTGEPFELLPGQQLDLGTVSTPPRARLRVALRAPAGTPIEKPRAELGASYQRQVLKWNGTHLVADNATAGRHRLIVRTQGWFAPKRSVDLVAGQETVVTIDVVRGALRRLAIAMPLPDQWQRCTFTVRDGNGTVLAEEEGKPSHHGVRPYPWYTTLPFGQFTLEAELDGRSRSWPLDLRDDPPSPRVLRFSLR